MTLRFEEGAVLLPILGNKTGGVDVSFSPPGFALLSHPPHKCGGQDHVGNINSDLHFFSCQQQRNGNGGDTAGKLSQDHCRQQRRGKAGSEA